MSSTIHQELFSKAEIKSFVAELMKDLGHAVHKKTADKTSDNRDETEARDKAILRGELARAKHQHAKEVASDPAATNKELIKALGGDSSVSPLQLAKLVKEERSPKTEAPQEDFMRRVLGSKPSGRELSRYAELVEAARVAFLHRQTAPSWSIMASP